MKRTISVCLIFVGLINLAPAVGLLSSAMLQNAYGIVLASDDLVILMRHRALLFGILGGFVLYAAFVTRYQLAAMTMAAASMLGFIVLAYASDSDNRQIGTIVMIDMIGMVFLIVALLLKTRQKAGD